MQMEHSQSARIALRLRAARERAGLTQRELSVKLGFENRQTLATIESGERRLSAEELLKVVNILGVDLDYFTDAFRLVPGEGRFSFRAQAGVSAKVLDQFEDRAGRWIATYSQLGSQQGEGPHLVGLKLDLTARSAFEEAQTSAEAIARLWRLGRTPAETLQNALEEHLRALVLHVAAPIGISGAASQVPGLNCVLVNKNEPEGRRSFDLAHEAFHLLTWDAMPPDRVESADVPRGGKARRVEQLAESFASALLMPADEMRRRWDTRDPHSDMHAWLNSTAEALRVSAIACKWRLHNLGCLTRADLLDINDQRLVANGRTESSAPVRSFSERFVQRIATALDTGRLSVRRAATLLGLSLEDLAALLAEYGIEPSFQA